MTIFAITAQYPVFTDLDGTPLENGYVWFGVVDENPITNPITVYWDDAAQYPVAQPLRTLAGAPNRNGSPSNLYCDQDYSILIKDKNNQQIYYSPNGNKFYDAETNFDNYNHVLNGDFRLRQYTTSLEPFDLFIEDTVSYSLVTNQRSFTGESDKPEDYLKFYASLGVNGLASPTSADYGRVVTILEDVTRFANKTITMSWFDRYAGLNVYGVSMTQNISDGATYVTGIGTTTFNPGSIFTKRNLTVKIPSIYEVGIDFDDQELIAKSGLMICFWLAAGNDFAVEAGGIGHPLSGSFNLVDICDLKFQVGDTEKVCIPRPIGEELKLVNRLYERSVNLYTNPYSATTGFGDSPIMFIAPGALTTIPGFRFTAEKRINDPDVHVYSFDSGAIDTVYRDGVGDIAVSSYNDIDSTGVGSITLATPTVDGDAYLYNWSADAVFRP